MEKKQTNHWFVAYDQAGELRVSGWSSRNRLRPGSKHLCGQTCLHKLVDDFMARALSARPQQVASDEAEVEKLTPATDASLAPNAVHVETQSPTRLVASPLLPTHKPLPLGAPAGPVAVPHRPPIDAPTFLLQDEPPSYAPRNLRAEAWERERQRELRASERADTTKRRRSGV
jgi:hypothetical protein